MMKTKTTLLGLLVSSTFLFSQVGIGTTSPNASSVLDITSNNKGVLMPRIALQSSTDQTTIPSPATGLMVYNTGTGSLTYKGFVFWSGTEWRSVENNTLIAPVLSQINCQNAALSPFTYTAGVPFSGTLSVPYSDGNGGQYAGGTSTSVNGLTFTLRPGTLQVGAGYLYFSVSGTPTVSSPSPSNITINSSLVPFYTGGACSTTNVGVGQETASGSIASAGYDIGTSTPTQSVTCFDGGNFCVRYNGSTANQPLQIKQSYGANQVALTYSYWGTGDNSNSGVSSFKNTNLPQNTWTTIYDFGGANNTEGVVNTVTLTDKTTAKIRSFNVEADVVINSEIGISGGRDKLFLRLTKN